MPRPDKSKPMPLKYWSFAGLLLTYWCNARCASCYVCSSPSAGCDMDVEDGLAFWAGLHSASPHGCRIHIGGGEPFGRWETLIELARRAHRDGLGPLEAVETNAHWATDAAIVRDRLAVLDEAGMGRLVISADPYHQQFVPIARVRLTADVAEDVLGGDRVRVRWRDWAAEGFDTDRLDASRRRALFAAYARKGRDRLSGRAASELAELLPLRPADAFADSSCKERLLRSRHVHVDANGILCPGTCAGIVLGRATGAGAPGGQRQSSRERTASVSEIWQGLSVRFADIQRNCDAFGSGQTDVIGLLAQRGPTALMKCAERWGYGRRAGGYASKCHLCWDVRRWLFENGYFLDQLGPSVIYRP